MPSKTLTFANKTKAFRKVRYGRYQRHRNVLSKCQLVCKQQMLFNLWKENVDRGFHGHLPLRIYFEMSTLFL